jgi:hypothetical protein
MPRLAGNFHSERKTMTDISIDDRAVIIAGIGPDGTPVKVAVGASGAISGSSDVTGIPRNRLILVSNDAAPLDAGNGSCNWIAPGTRGWEIQSARLSVNLAQVVNIPNLRVRWAVAGSAAEAAGLLPAEASLVFSGTSDIGLVGFFDVEPALPANITTGTWNIRLSAAVPINLSTPNTKLYFRHALGGDLQLGIAAVEEVL